MSDVFTLFSTLHVFQVHRNYVVTIVLVAEEDLLTEKVKVDG